MSNSAKNAMKHSENTTYTCLEAFEKCLKTLFSAQKSGSRLRCRTMLKKTWNTQKTPTRHVLRLFKNFWKIWFSAQKSGSRRRCRTMLKKIPWNTQKTPTKHVLRLFKKFLKIRFSAQKSGSRPRCRTMLKYFETLRKHQLNTLWGILRNFWKSDSWLKNPVLGSDVE